MESYVKESWHKELVQVSKRLSQGQIARRLDCSSAMVSQVLNGRYLSRRVLLFKERFEGAFMGYCVNCPVVGELPRDQCLNFQSREFCGTNPTRVQLYHACRSGCEHSRIPMNQLDVYAQPYGHGVDGHGVDGHGVEDGL